MTIPADPKPETQVSDDLNGDDLALLNEISNAYDKSLAPTSTEKFREPDDVVREIDELKSQSEPTSTGSAREFWIQKGTPDLVCDSIHEAESCTHPLRSDIPWHHVIEKSAYDAQSAQISRLEETIARHHRSVLNRDWEKMQKTIDGLTTVVNAWERFSADNTPESRIDLREAQKALARLAVKNG